MKVKKVVRAVIYLRQSKDRAGDGLAIERQRKDCEALCDQRGWTVVEVIADNDVSASTGRRRQGFERVLAMIDRRDIDAVVVWHADRLVRRLVDLETVIEKCERTRVKLITVSGDLDLGTDAGRLNARILASVARGEVERKSERQKASARQAAEAGLPHPGGRRVFGYRDGGLEVEPAEARIVAELYRRFNQGASLYELQVWINQRGIRTTRGNQWTGSSVRKLLLNPRACGLRGQQTVATTGDGAPITTVNGNVRRTPTYEIITRGAWPAIVSEEEWRSACDRLTGNVRRRRAGEFGRNNARKHLLPAVARCGWTDPETDVRCGKPIRSGSSHLKPQLICITLQHVSRRMEPVDEYVVDVLLARLRRPDAVELLRSEVDGIDLRAVRDEGDAIRARRQRMNVLYANGAITEHEHAEMLEATRVRLDEIDAQLAAAGRGDVVAEVLGQDRDPAEVWDGMPLSARRGLVDALMVVWVLPGRPGRFKGGQMDPSTIDIQWRER